MTTMRPARLSPKVSNGNTSPRTTVSLSTKVLELLRGKKDEEIITLLEGSISEEDKRSLCSTFKDDESILHVAVKTRTNLDVISALINTCPELLVASRQNSDLYRGQTALHMAITGCDIETADLLLRRTQSYNILTLNHLLSIRATGSRFVNTVMLAEIPLLVAALTLNSDMFAKILECQKKIDAINSRGDNVCHCLIRYANLYPEKLPDVIQMLKYIATITDGSKAAPEMATKSTLKHNIDETDMHNVHIWLMKNDRWLNPLQLAAKLGQQRIFKMITEMKGVYCYSNEEDGLFDVEMYDVTDIDAISDITTNDLEEEKLRKKLNDKNNPAKYKSVLTLEMIFNSEPNVVFKFIQLSPLRYVIGRKWSFYRWFYAAWGILHILFMIGFTFYSVRRSATSLKQSQNHTIIETITNEIPKDGFVTFYLILSLAVSIMLLNQEIIRIAKGRMPWTWSHLMNCYHNGPFRLMLVTFAAFSLADIVWYLINPQHGDFFMVIAMILGWWFLVFFLRGFRQFSFFTVMIQKIIVGDMFRFSIIIGMELIAFTTALYIVFQGANTSDENMEDYSKLLIQMFKMMFGLTSLDVLFEARHPWFAVCMYTAFVLLTFVLMVNSLIAMMSNTCSVVSQNRDVQYRVQQLSIILFFESIFPVSFLHKVGQPQKCKWYDSATGRVTTVTRYFMEVRSLKEVTKSRSRIRQGDENMLTSILNALMSIQMPSSEASPTIVEDKTILPENELPCIVEARRDLSNPPTNQPGETRTDEKPRKKKNLKKRKGKKTELPPLDGLDAADDLQPEPGVEVDDITHGINRVTPMVSTDRSNIPQRFTLDIHYIDT